MPFHDRAMPSGAGRNVAARSFETGICTLVAETDTTCPADQARAVETNARGYASTTSAATSMARVGGEGATGETRRRARPGTRNTAEQTIRTKAGYAGITSRKNEVA